MPRFIKKASIDHPYLNEALDGLCKEGMILDVMMYYGETRQVGDIVTVWLYKVKYTGIITNERVERKDKDGWTVYNPLIYLLTDDGWAYVKGILAEQKIEAYARA